MVYIYFTKIFALFYNNEYVGREFGFENELFKWLLHLQQEYILRAWYSFHVNMQWQMYTHIHIYILRALKCVILIRQDMNF